MHSLVSDYGDTLVRHVESKAISFASLTNSHRSSVHSLMRQGRKGIACTWRVNEQFIAEMFIDASASRDCYIIDTDKWRYAKLSLHIKL